MQTGNIDDLVDVCNNWNKQRGRDLQAIALYAHSILIHHNGEVNEWVFLRKYTG